jgi:hypothetical protein
MISTYIWLSGIFLLGAVTGAVAVIIPVWSRYTAIEYKNCELRRQLRQYERYKQHNEQEESGYQEKQEEAA